MKLWFVFFATLTVATALTTTPSTPSIVSCIDGCKCKDSYEILNVVECEKPLILNQAAFEHVDKKINVIALENVIIQHIESGTFDGFPMLQDVVIKKCNIGSIYPNAFNLINKLKFSECHFEDSPDLISEKLEELHFGECKLEETPILDHLMSLTFLNLTGNYIKYFDIVTFASLNYLKELHLTDNNIFKLPADLFVNNHELSSLYLDRNPLKYFSLNTTNSLETLSLKSCKLTSFDEKDSYFLNKVSELDLSDNYISNLSANAFVHMTELTYINLSNNNLKKIDSTIFRRNIELQKIVLDGNYLKTLPSFTLEKKGKFEIYHFSCNRCGLTTLSANVFDDMQAILNLKLAQNNLEVVDDMFSQIHSLRNLDISNNQITTIGPKAFANNKNLESINLSGNPLKTLNPEIFAENHVINKIDARNTQLTRLWQNKNTILSSLRQLLVSNNQLQKLTMDDLQVTPRLSSIDLNNNKFSMGEDLCQLMDWLEHNSSIYPIEYKNIDEFTSNMLIDNEDHEIKTWEHVFNVVCPKVTRKNIVVETTKMDLNDLEKLVIEDTTTDDYDGYYDDDSYNDESIVEEVGIAEDSSLIRASNILSITSVFIVTALIVLTIAVTITLFVLKRNSAFNMQKANLPHFKIPLWNTQAAHKKHSGSVYRPLSEDLSGPKTPKLSRYDFSDSPTVHSISS